MDGNQGDEEARRGLPVTSVPQCDRRSRAWISRGQKAFIGLVAKPTLEALDAFAQANAGTVNYRGPALGAADGLAQGVGLSFTAAAGTEAGAAGGPEVLSKPRLGARGLRPYLENLAANLAFWNEASNHRGLLGWARSCSNLRSCFFGHNP